MTDEHQPPDLKNISDRLRKARGEEQASGPGAAPAGMGIALRMVTEMAAALVVGGLLGWFIDGWLGTRPWGLVVMLALGAAAGILAAFREAQWVSGSERGE